MMEPSVEMLVGRLDHGCAINLLLTILVYLRYELVSDRISDRVEETVRSKEECSSMIELQAASPSF